jgi:hypothetical protein
MAIANILLPKNKIRVYALQEHYYGIKTVGVNI